MAKIGASGKNILRGRSPWTRGIPTAGRASGSSNQPPRYRPNNNVPGADGEKSCPVVGTHNNPYNIEDYYEPKGFQCIWPGGGKVTPDGEYIVDDCDLPLGDVMRFPTTPWGDLEDKFKKVGDKGIKASDTIGYGAGWGVPKEYRAVVGIFWPSQSEMVDHINAGMAPWTKAEMMQHLGNKLKDTIRDFTHGQVELVGGSALPGPIGTNPSDLDFVWVGCPAEAADGVTEICGNAGTGWLNCGCGGPNGHRLEMQRWFKNNGYPDGTTFGTDTRVEGWDVKLGINLDCFTDDLFGSAGADPLLFVSVDKTAGLSEEPFTEFDMTNVAQVLGSGRVAQVAVHEIGHGIGHVHLSKYLGTFGGQPNCYAEPFHSPQYHCNRSGYSYNGTDNLDTMSYGGGAENRFGLYRESHFSAYKKFLQGKIPVPWGAADLADVEQFPPQCVHFPNPAAIGSDGDQKIQLHAHDQQYDHPDIVANIADSKTMLLLIRRDIDVSEAYDDINCESANAQEQLTPERYLAISYRRRAFWRECEGVAEPQNGVLVIDWGPVRANGASCGASSKYGTGVLSKTNADDLTRTLTFESYTANGRSFPQLDIKVVENRGNPGEIGPDSIIISVKQT